jgi:hypothetical protein
MTYGISTLNEMVDWWFELVGGLQKLDKCLPHRINFPRDEVEKTFAKYSRKACASWTLLLAQGPCDVLISEKDFLACYIFFIAFHREQSVDSIGRRPCRDFFNSFISNQNYSDSIS